VITDVNDYRLNLVREICDAHTVNVARESLEDKMRELHIEEGFDIGLEMSGSGQAFNSMIDHMYNGGKIAVLGLQGSDTVVPWNKIVINCLQLKGIYGREMFETWYKMQAMIKAGLDVTPIITHRYHYTEFEKGFEAMISGTSGKVVLDWTEKK